MTKVKRRKGLEEEALLILQASVASPTSQAHSPYWPTLPSLHLRHGSLCNPSVASPTSQFILQPFFRFSYVTSSSLNSPGEMPMGFSQSRCNVGWFRSAECGPIKHFWIHVVIEFCHTLYDFYCVQ